MCRRLFQSVLFLSLLANAIAAPWALARMIAAGHGGASVKAFVRTAEASTGLGDHDHDRVGHGCAQMPGASAADCDDCCDGASCQCGCVLPPALASGLASLPAALTDARALAAVPVLLPPSHEAPPLRPPAA